MLISIIVPVYNVEKYLKKCIESIINQTYKEVEIILVDDGSTDNSGKMCDNYKKIDNRIKVIHKKNEGLGYARNAGIKEANGTYITFIDSDDYIDSKFIETLCDNLKKSDVDYIKCSFKRIQDDEKIISYKIFDNVIYRQNEVKEIFLPKMLGSLPGKSDSIEMSAWGSLYKLSYIKNNNLSFPSERELISEDIIFNIKYMNYSIGAKVIDYCGYNYRYNPNSLTQRYKNDRFEKIKILYKEETRMLSALGYEDVAILRATKTFFINLKKCIWQEKKSISKKSRKDILKSINNICNDSLVKNIINNYPVKKLGLKQKTFIYLVLHNCKNIIYILITLNII